MKESTMVVDYVGRMYQERNELNARLAKAKVAVLSPALMETDRFLLLEQVQYMIAYTTVLSARIAEAENVSACAHGDYEES